MAKQLNVDLRVRAETEEAKKKLAELQRQLAGIQSTPTHLFDDQDLKKASQAAAELSKHIQNATNADTGKLDLTRFASSLKKSNKELKDYRQDLERLGPAGQQAFLSIARSITNAEAPTVRLTQRMNEFLTTMKNTARWQISSSILHGFMGTVQSAFGYAQDLNKSLNDIRIVTGKSTEEMAAFAKEANKSAVALSTSTTSYTDAALIFYQQGLSDEEVKKRTDVTAKMANVTGEAAEQVSSYMTAIWNNFNKAGDESEQHFADILTALGAATASSSAEIAGGLEKFAAIADATGLSYDYAASALATLVSNTRQSEDVVGTSLKTIFSRIQGVSLGETLEDGVDLNKYSEALEKIGVNVLDLDGNMRDLDDILDDTAVKWETLSRAEQMATAQTVAGVRQYNQFISLMDNWDDMEANLDIARSADGSLDEQADIYAESWEAARKRVQASLQAIYQELVNDEFFIDLNNGLAQTIDIIGGLLDGLGGVKGLLGIIGGLITQHFAKELPAAMERLKENAIYLSGFGDKINKKAQSDVSSNLSAMPVNTENNTWNVEVQGAQKLSELKEQLLQKQNQMSEAERASAQAIMQQAEADYQRLGILAQIADQKKAALEATKNEIATQATQQESDRVQGETGKGFDTSTFKEQKKLIKETVNELQGYYKALAQIKQQGKIFKDQAAQYKKNNTSLKDMKKAVSEYLKTLEKSGKIKLNDKQWDRLKSAISETNQEADELIAALDEIGNHNGMDGMDSVFYAVDEASGAAAQSVDEINQGLLDAEDRLNGVGVSGAQLANLEEDMQGVADAEANLQAHTDAVGNSIDGIGDHTLSVSETLGTFAGSLMSLSALMSSASSTWDTMFNDEDATTMDKITAGIGFLTTAIFAYTGAMKLAKIGQDLATKSLIAKVGAENIGSISAVKAAMSNATLTASIWAQTLALLSNPLTAAIAIAAIVAGIAIFAAAQSNAAAETEKHTKAIEEQTEASKKAAKEHGELIQSFSDAYNQFKDTGEMTDELRDATDKLTDAYDLQGGSLAKLSGDYDDYINHLKEARKTELDNAKADAKASKKQAGQAFIDKMREDVGNFSGGRYKANFGDGKAGWWDQDDEKKILDKYRENTLAYSKLSTSSGELNVDSGQSAEEMAQAYEQVQQLVQAIQTDDSISDAYLQNSEVYNGMLDWLEKSEEAYNNYKAAADLIQEYNVEESFLNAFESITDPSAIKTVDEYLAKREEVIASVMAEQGIVSKTGAQYEEIVATVDAYMDTFSNLQELHDLDKAFSEIVDKSRLTREEVEALYEEHGSVLFQVDFDTVQTKANVELAIQKAQNEADLQAVEIASDIKVKIETALSKGEDIDEEDFQSFKEQYGDKIDWEAFDAGSYLDQIREIEKSTADTVANLNETYTINEELAEQEKRRSEYMDYLERKSLINSQISEAMAPLWDKKISGEWNDELQAEWDYWTEQLESVNAQWEQIEEHYSDVAGMTAVELTTPIVFEEIDINDTIFKQLSETINGMVFEADALKCAAEAIGEGFLVAAEDAQVLAKMYPELLKNAIVYEDGRVQLDAAATKAILGDEAILLEQDKAAVSEKLRGQIALLDAQISFYETKATLLQQALDGEISYDEAVQGIKDAEAQFETDIDDWCTQNNMDNDTKSTDLALDNLDLLDARIAEVSEHYSAMLSGEIVQASQSGSAYTGTSGGNSDKPTQYDNSEYQTILEQQLQSTNDQLKYLYQQRADLVALESRNNAALDESITALDNAANGLGGDYDPDSGDDKTPSIEKTKNEEDDLERYHEINDVIDDLEESIKDLNREYDKLNTQTDRAFGAQKIKLMQKQRQEIDKQVAAIDKQIEAQKKLLEEQKKYLEKDKSDAQKAGWQFDEAGNVTNYEATLNMLKAQYNAVVDAYNALSAEAQEAFMKNVDANGNNPIQQAEETYKKALEALKQYESTREAIEDTENTIADKEKERLEKLQAQYDILLAEVQTEIELKISVDDTALDLLKDKLEDLGDSADNALDIIANINQQVNRVQTKTETYREGIGKTLDTLKDYGVSEEDLTKVKSAIADGSLGKMNTEDIQAMFSSSEIVDYGSLISDLQEYSNELLAMNEEIRAYKDQVFDTMSAAFNEYLEDLERYEAKTEHAKKLTQGYKDLITSLGKANIDKDGSLTKQINEALVSESKDALREAQATQDYAQSAFDKAKAEYEKYSTQGSPWYNEEMARKWKAQMEECEDALMAAEEKTQEALQATAEAIKTAFKDTITQIMDDLDDSLGSVSHLQQQFDQAQELSEQYLDDYKKIYELSKLTRQVNKTMDETNNVKAKKMLMEYQAKINKYQQDGVKMSQYELEHLQKEYELRLAQIQLEEAQNAKSQVRMTRDSEGNYGYVYTADDSAQSDAQQNYEDKLYALQELNTQYITEMQRLSLEIQAQWQETLNQILEDDSLSLAEQQARIAEASDFYTQRLAYVNEQLGIAVGNNRTLYEEDWTKYSEVTGYKISADEDYVDTWGETTLAVLTGAHDQQGYYQSVQLAFSTAVASIQQETAKYQEALNAVGLSADALAGKISADVEVQKQASNEAALAAEDMSQRAQGAMEEIMNKAGEFSERWVTELEATITKNQEYVQSILDMITALSDLDAAANTPKPSNPPVDPGDGGGGGNPGDGGSGGGGGTPNNADKIEGVAAAIWMDGGGTSGWYNGNDRVSRLQEKGVTAAQAYINQHGPNGDIYAAWHNKRAQLKSFYYGSFDTGGYTGDWGDSEGRLALLHSKELVLNAQDTENMLAIIDMVRQISSAIDTNALSTLMSSGLTAASVNAKGNDVLEQHVTITAEFPNATDKDSILDAFDNVINLAAQYANRR